MCYRLPGLPDGWLLPAWFVHEVWHASSLALEPGADFRLVVAAGEDPGPLAPELHPQRPRTLVNQLTHKEKEERGSPRTNFSQATGNTLVSTPGRGFTGIQNSNYNEILKFGNLIIIN